MHELNQHKIAALLPQRRAQSNKGSYGSVAAAAGSLCLPGGCGAFVWRVRCAPGPGWCPLPAWSR